VGCTGAVDAGKLVALVWSRRFQILCIAFAQFSRKAELKFDGALVIGLRPFGPARVSSPKLAPASAGALLFVQRFRRPLATGGLCYCSLACSRAWRYWPPQCAAPHSLAAIVSRLDPMAVKLYEQRIPGSRRSRLARPQSSSYAPPWELPSRKNSAPNSLQHSSTE